MKNLNRISQVFVQLYDRINTDSHTHQHINLFTQSKIKNFATLLQLHNKADQIHFQSIQQKIK